MAWPRDRLVVCQWMIDELKLSGTPLLVYAAIYEAGPRGAAVSQTELAYRCGSSRTGIKRALAHLAASGAIERLAAPPGGGRPSIWRAAGEAATAHWTAAW